MFKPIASAVLCISIVACSSEENNQISDDLNSAINNFTTAIDDFAEELGEVDVNVPVTVEDENGNLVDLIQVAGTGDTTTVNSENKTNLTISGSGNTVNVETNLGTLSVAGANNLVVFSENVTIDSCFVGGSDNIAQKPDSVSLACDVGGPGNSGF